MTLFASRSLVVHVVRGLIGIAALTYAVKLGPSHPLVSLGLLGLMLVAFGGCPICWTMGLVETVQKQFRR